MNIKHLRRYRLPIIVLAVIAAFAIAFFAYAGNYYRALPEAESVAAAMEKIDGNLYFFADSDKGFIIYPGGKVDEKAYAPLAKGFYDSGYNAVILKMPFHLSIFDSNRAEKVIEENPQVKTWVIIGHSLGGTSASIFAERYHSQIDGVVFLGSYPYKDLAAYDIWALDIVGSNDEILDRETAAKYESYYPSDTLHETIEGGNHSYYGMYGLQKGDGEAAITNAEQIDITVRMILEEAE